MSEYLRSGWGGNLGSLSRPRPRSVHSMEECNTSPYGNFVFLNLSLYQASTQSRTEARGMELGLRVPKLGLRVYRPSWITPKSVSVSGKCESQGESKCANIRLRLEGPAWL